MALFGFGKKNEKKAPKAEKSSGDSKARSVKLEAGSKKKLQLSTSKIAVATTAKDVLLRPRITEKAANMGSESVYTFDVRARSEEHTSELQSQFHLVCRLLLVKI